MQQTSDQRGKSARLLARDGLCFQKSGMGLYNFQARFVPFILAGAKTHTIRAVRANPDKPGNTLHLYTGLRHKGARLLMRVPCVKVEEIEIDACGHECNCDPFVAIDGVELNR